jgi:hypothetical protein
MAGASARTVRRSTIEIGDDTPFSKIGTACAALSMNPTGFERSLEGRVVLATSPNMFTRALVKSVAVVAV